MTRSSFCCLRLGLSLLCPDWRATSSDSLTQRLPISDRTTSIRELTTESPDFLMKFSREVKSTCLCTSRWVAPMTTCWSRGALNPFPCRSSLSQSSKVYFRSKISHSTTCASAWAWSSSRQMRTSSRRSHTCSRTSFLYLSIKRTKSDSKTKRKTMQRQGWWPAARSILGARTISTWKRTNRMNMSSSQIANRCFSTLSNCCSRCDGPATSVRFTSTGSSTWWTTVFSFSCVSPNLCTHITACSLRSTFLKGCKVSQTAKIRKQTHTKRPICTFRKERKILRSLPLSRNRTISSISQNLSARDSRSRDNMACSPTIVWSSSGITKRRTSTSFRSSLQHTLSSGKCARRSAVFFRNCRKLCFTTKIPRASLRNWIYSTERKATTRYTSLQALWTHTRRGSRSFWSKLAVSRQSLYKRRLSRFWASWRSSKIAICWYTWPKMLNLSFSVV